MRGRALLVVALVAAAVLRLPSLWHDLLSDDEAIYAAMGEVLAGGGVMYRDTVDHKPPGLASTYAAVRALVGGDATVGPGVSWMTGVHLLGILWVIATCLALDRLGLRLLGERLRSVPALLYAVVSAAKVPHDGLAVNGELLMNLPLALGALCAIEAGRRRGAPALLLDVGAGAMAAVAVLYKYQAGALLVCLPLLLVDGNRRPAAQVVARLAGWLTGAALVFGLTAAYFHSRGALADALFWGVAFNRNYLAEGPGPQAALTRLATQALAVVAPGLSLYAAAWRGLVGRPRAGLSAGWFLVGWALLSLGALALGGRFFGHYFLQAELPLAVIAAAPFAAFHAARPRLAVAALAVPAVGFFLLAALPAARTDALLHADDPDWRAMSRGIAARTTPSDTLWVWGNVPQLYAASGRRQGARFAFSNYLTGLSPGSPSEVEPGAAPPARAAVERAWPMLIADLEAKRPALIIDTAAAGMKSYGKFPIADFPVLSSYLARHYRREGDVGGASVYVRAD